jgi:hypothetical protein
MQVAIWVAAGCATIAWFLAAFPFLPIRLSRRFRTRRNRYRYRNRP